MGAVTVRSPLYGPSPFRRQHETASGGESFSHRRPTVSSTVAFAKCKMAFHGPSFSIRVAAYDLVRSVHFRDGSEHTGNLLGATYLGQLTFGPLRDGLGRRRIRQTLATHDSTQHLDHFGGWHAGRDDRLGPRMLNAAP